MAVVVPLEWSLTSKWDLNVVCDIWFIGYSVQNKTKNIWLPNHNGAAFMKGIVQCRYKLLRKQERNAKEKVWKKKRRNAKEKEWFLDRKRGSLQGKGMKIWYY